MITGKKNVGNTKRNARNERRWPGTKGTGREETMERGNAEDESSALRKRA